MNGCKSLIPIAVYVHKCIWIGPYVFATDRDNQCNHAAKNGYIAQSFQQGTDL